jgi:hypothetical protein
VHLDDVSGLAMESRYGAGAWRGDLQRGFVCHHITDGLIGLDGVARRDMPLRNFGFYDAFSHFG